MSVAGLLTQWRRDAGVLRAWGANNRAATLERAAAQLEAEQAAEADEMLTLEASALASGYSVEALRKMVATGRVPNAGRKHAPRIRRADLPKRAPRLAGDDKQASSSTAYDPESDALSLMRVHGRAS